jgi:hypothetical protein
MAAGNKIAPLRRDDIPELSEFLVSGFGVPADSPYFSHEVLAWKYFDGPCTPAGDAADSTCSLVARSAGKIVAHIGMCYRDFVVSGDASTPVSTMHAIDWLGSAAHPGSGALLILEAFKTCKTQFAVDGSPQSQALFPRLGFEPKPTVAVFRRVLSPFHRLKTADQGLFGRWARTAKDLLSMCRGRTQKVKQSVELRPAPAFTADIDGLLRQSTLRMVTCQRDHRLLNYLLRCPLAGFSGWTIHSSERMIGFALVKVTPHGRVHLGKIVDCWLDTDDASLWHAAIAGLITRLRAQGADDVTCYGTNPSLHSALLGNGFVKSGEHNVCVRDKQQLLPRDLPFGLSGFEADGAIL